MDQLALDPSYKEFPSLNFQWKFSYEFHYVTYQEKFQNYQNLQRFIILSGSNLPYQVKFLLFNLLKIIFPNSTQNFFDFSGDCD
jgi:hypothetical protein